MDTQPHSLVPSACPANSCPLVAPSRPSGAHQCLTRLENRPRGEACVSWEQAGGHLGRGLQRPRYGECGLEGDEEGPPLALLTPHPTGRVVAGAAPRQGTSALPCPGFTEPRLPQQPADLGLGTRAASPSEGCLDGPQAGLSVSYVIYLPGKSPAGPHLVGLWWGRGDHREAVTRAHLYISSAGCLSQCAPLRHSPKWAPAGAPLLALQTETG